MQKHFLRRSMVTSARCVAAVKCWMTEMKSKTKKWRVLHDELSASRRPHSIFRRRLTRSRMSPSFSCSTPHSCCLISARALTVPYSADVPLCCSMLRGACFLSALHHITTHLHVRFQHWMLSPLMRITSAGNFSTVLSSLLWQLWW